MIGNKKKEINLIIGVTGHPASGKDAVAEYLEEKGFAHLSGGNILREKMKEKGMSVDRTSVREFAKEMRAKVGNHYPYEELADMVSGDTVVSGLRNLAEMEVFKRKFPDSFLCVGVDCPLEVRYERAASRGRIGDDVTFERFKEEEERERLEDSGSHEVDKVIAEAHAVLDNSGTKEELFEKIEELLAKWRETT